jgi:iron complex outermembrane receptor protein
VLTVIPLEDKTVVDSPWHIASGDIAYDGEPFFGRVGANYMSKRYYSYLNDVSVDGRLVVDASIGIKVPGGRGFLSGFALETSVTNLLDRIMSARSGRMAMAIAAMARRYRRPRRANCS